MVYSDPQRVARRQLRLTVEQGALRMGSRTASRRRDGVDGGGAEAASALVAQGGAGRGVGTADGEYDGDTSRLQAAVEDSDSDDWEWLGAAARGSSSLLCTWMRRTPPEAVTLKDPPVPTRWLQAGAGAIMPTIPSTKEPSSSIASTEWVHGLDRAGR